jgi:hypothetical protein
VLFATGEREYRLSDVVRAASAWGDLETLEQVVREGLACLERAGESDELPTREETEAQAAEFRYARDLISADEALAWLDARELTVEDWTEYLHRVLLRARWASELGTTLSAHPTAPEDVDEVLYVEGVCSGVYGKLSSRLAGRAAVLSRARAEGWLAADADNALPLEEMAQAVEELRARAVTPETIQAEVVTRHLDWVRVQCDAVWFPVVHQAREAVLCVREDGRALGEVAAAAGAELVQQSLYLEEAELAWRDRLLAGRPGDLIGPLQHDDGFVVVRLRSKALPSADDENIRERAEDSLLDRVIAQEVTNRVKWRCRL